VASESGADREFVISRVFDAPRRRVWQAFTELERLKHWWGPKGFAWMSGTLELRPGGVFLYGMRSPDGHEIWGKWVFREIVAPERLVFVLSFADPATGHPVRHPMSPTWPLEMLSAATFADQAGKTLLTTRVAAINPSEEERRTFEAGFESMNQGYGGTWDKLADYLKTT
jgi:uncharacterized protein YndB with AHSA1/START domain